MTTTTHRHRILRPGDDLAAAIAAAGPGEVLVLGPGRHRAPALTIRRPLALLADGEAVLATPGLTLDAGGAVALRDLAVEGPVRVAGATRADLRDCRIVGTPGPGLMIDEDADAEVRSCLVERCGGAGVLVAGRAAALLEGCILLDNAGAGLAWDDEARGEAHGNLAEGNALGIRVGGRAAPWLAHNTLRRNRGDGIVYLDQAGGRASANLCDGNRGHDILIDVANGAGPAIGANRAFVSRR